MNILATKDSPMYIRIPLPSEPVVFSDGQDISEIAELKTVEYKKEKLMIMEERKNREIKRPDLEEVKTFMGSAWFFTIKMSDTLAENRNRIKLERYYDELEEERLQIDIFKMVTRKELEEQGFEIVKNPYLQLDYTRIYGVKYEYIEIKSK